MKTTVGPETAAVANVEISAQLAGANAQRASGRSEILFVDPSVSALGTILGNLRPGVEAIVLDSARPAARQIASALDGRRGLRSVHIMAHGAPGRVSFAAGDLVVRNIGRLGGGFRGDWPRAPCGRRSQLVELPRGRGRPRAPISSRTWRGRPAPISPRLTGSSAPRPWVANGNYRRGRIAPRRCRRLRRRAWPNMRGCLMTT